MFLNNVRCEVMAVVAQQMDSFMEEYSRPIDTNWQPADLLPDSSSSEFFSEVKHLQEGARELPYDFLAVLIGDTITEEALPTYEAWLMDTQGIDQQDSQGWTRWVRSWTAEENRHGDVLNRYLYLCGRVNMRALETSTQHLLAEGFAINTDRDPYRTFVYTSFQELATNISHRRTATLAKQYGNQELAKLCGLIAADEARHAKAYQAFVSRIYEIDPSEMMVAFESMMRRKIVMPAHLLRETAGGVSRTFAHFSDAAQRLGVYTTRDYVAILDTLLEDWKVGHCTGLNEAGEKARDYLMALPARMLRVAERLTIPTLEYPFSWIR
ncbi:MAG: acyl-ACP desaturase [Cytophagaceae bacterium]|nr:acyl-ACP desaturase [Cytophagaceae bacterium]